MDKIETPKEFSLKMLQMSINDVPQREIIKAITARDAAIRAETAKDAMRWFDNYRKERGQSGNEAALHKSLCAAICRKEVVG